VNTKDIGPIRKKLAFGTTAGAVVLLLATGSTYAAWSQSDELGAGLPGDIVTAEWTFDLAVDGEWYDVTPEDYNGPGVEDPQLIADLGNFPLAPGHTIQGLFDVDVTNIDFDNGGDYFTVDVTALDASTASAAASLEFLTAAAAINTTGQLVVTVDFPYSSTAYDTQSGKSATVSVSDVAVTVTQVIK